MLDQLTMLALTPYATIVGIFVLVLMILKKKTMLNMKIFRIYAKNIRLKKI